ncbi:unnamed protein product [Cladocopium goreaui]|uniref:Dynein heavy chain-like protein 2 n=1 Tax=Cladocopium goreaui TaxID=2562237 RepID=A0A9P1GK76_9DINO|nr:unnamed protein product [Cladocopium goreaui]
MPPHSYDDEKDDVVLDPKSLAGILDSSDYIRARLRFKEEGRLLRWPKGKDGQVLVGSITMVSVAHNVKALTLLAKYWCPQAKLKKNVIEGPDIELVRKEVFQLKSAAKFPLNPALLQVDSWGLKKLFSYAGRKAGFWKNGKSPKRRDPVVEEFYSELFKHWRLKKGVNIPCVEIDDDKDDPNFDLDALFEVKAEPGEELSDDDSDVELTDQQDPYMAVMDLTENQGDKTDEDNKNAVDPPAGQAVEATQRKDQQSESGDAVSVGVPKGEVAADPQEPSSVKSVPESVRPSTTCPAPSAIPEKKQNAALDERIARLKLLFELAQRRAAKAGHIDTVDTQPFEATLAAERFEQGSPPVVSSQVAPPEEQPDRVCRSLARDFSNANLGKPDDNTGRPQVSLVDTPGEELHTASGNGQGNAATQDTSATPLHHPEASAPKGLDEALGGGSGKQEVQESKKDVKDEKEVEERQQDVKDEKEVEESKEDMKDEKEVEERKKVMKDEKEVGESKKDVKDEEVEEPKEDVKDEKEVEERKNVVKDEKEVGESKEDVRDVVGEAALERKERRAHEDEVENDQEQAEEHTVTHDESLEQGTATLEPRQHPSENTGQVDDSQHVLEPVSKKAKTKKCDTAPPVVLEVEETQVETIEDDNPPAETLEAKAAAKRKCKKGSAPVEVVASDDEGNAAPEAEETEVASQQASSKKKVRSRAVRKATGKAKSKANAAASAASTEDTANKRKEQDNVKYEVVNQEGKTDINSAFGWEEEEQEQDHQQGESSASSNLDTEESSTAPSQQQPAPEEHEEPEDPKEPKLPSFARRPVEWWEWCMKAFGQDQSLEEKTQFTEAAFKQIQPFLKDTCLELTSMPYGLPRGSLNLAKFGVGPRSVRGDQGSLIVLQAEKQKLQEGEQRPVPTPVRALGEAGPEDETVPADLDSFEVLQLSLDPYMGQLVEEPLEAGVNGSYELDLMAALKGLVEDVPKAEDQQGGDSAPAPSPASGGDNNDVKVLRRLFTPRKDGSYLVPMEFVEKFKDIAGGGRAEVLRLYKDKCNGNKDSFIHTCRKKVERIKEDDLWADGEFMTEQDMIDDNYRQDPVCTLSGTRIQAIIAECRKHKGWVRRDKYEKNVECFWVETKVGGRKLKRRRETICEDDSMSEDEAGKFKKEFDDNAMLAKRAADIDSALCKVETEITRVNTKGIIDSFSSELLGFFGNPNLAHPQYK